MTDTSPAESPQPTSPRVDGVDRDDPDAVWADLLARYTAAAASRDYGTTPAHIPEVAILACADARLSPSTLFDAEPGSMFVVRHAGNTALPPAVASLDFAVGYLGVRLVLVLGHTECGAVTAAFDGEIGADLAPVVEPIVDVVEREGCRTVDEAIVANVAATVDALGAGSGPLGQAARRGDVVIRGAVKDLTTGELRVVEPASTHDQNENPINDTQETP